MPLLVHGTAIAVGTTGIVLTGPSGAGKTSTALRLMAEARRSGHFAALLSDDQLHVERAGGRLIATPPEAIRGMIELRGSGIGKVPTIGSMLLDFALAPVAVDSHNRIPEENQAWSPAAGISLPLISIDRAAADPFAILAALLPGFPVARAFQL